MQNCTTHGSNNIRNHPIISDSYDSVSRSDKARSTALERSSHHQSKKEREKKNTNRERGEKESGYTTGLGARGPFIRHFRCDIKPIANVCVTWRVRQRDSCRRNLSIVRGIISAAAAELWNYRPRGVVMRVRLSRGFRANFARFCRWGKKARITCTQHSRRCARKVLGHFLIYNIGISLIFIAIVQYSLCIVFIIISVHNKIFRLRPYVIMKLFVC